MSNPLPAQFLDHYAIFRKSEDSDDTVLRDKISGNFVLMKELLMPSNEEFKKIVETLEAQQSLRHQHLLTLLNYYTMAELGQDQISCHKVVTFFEYATHNLLEEIEVRYSETRLFEESEVWSILCSSVLGLAYLQKESVGHGCVSPIDIFIASDGTVRVVDPSIATSSPFVLQEGYYYSPEIMEYFRSPEEVSTEDLDIFKSDVFSLGMCVLHAALLQSANDCFDYENCTIDYEQINSKLTLFSEHYSKELTDMLVSMLSEDPANRPDFIDIEEQLMMMTQSNQPTRKTSANNRFETQAFTCTLLTQDREDRPSEQQGCPSVDAIDSWEADFNEDWSKEQGMDMFMDRTNLHTHVNQLVKETQIINQMQGHQIANEDRRQPPNKIRKSLEDGNQLLPVPQQNITQVSINTSFKFQSTPPPQLQAEPISPFLANASAIQQNSSILGTIRQEQRSTEQTIISRKVLEDCTPDKNTTTASKSQTQTIIVKPSSQYSQSQEESNRMNTSSNFSKGSIILQQEPTTPQQNQPIAVQFRPPTYRGLQHHSQIRAQPAVVQQTVTRIVEIQQTPAPQVQVLPQIVRTSHHFQQMRPGQVTVGSVIDKQITQVRSGVSPRNYLGYRPVGCIDQHLFTDPSLLNMMRQDMQRILSKSQLKNKENCC